MAHREYHEQEVETLRRAAREDAEARVCRHRRAARKRCKVQDAVSCSPVQECAPER